MKNKPIAIFIWKKFALSFVCVCILALIAAGAAAYAVTAHDHTGYNEISEGSQINTVADYTVLTGDIKAVGDITIANGSTATICLNGHTFDLNGYKIVVEFGGTLIIEDCSADMTGSIVNPNIINNNTDNSVDGGFYTALIQNGGTVTINGGTLINNETDTMNGGAAIYSTGTVTLNGGKLEGVYGILNRGECTVNGGNISAQKAAIQSKKNSAVPTVTIAGGTLSSSSALNYTLEINSGKLNLSGDGTITGGAANVYLGWDETAHAKFDVVGYLFRTQDSISLSLQSPEKALDHAIVYNCKIPSNIKLTNSGYAFTTDETNLTLGELCCTHDGTNFIKWNKSDAMPTITGYYCLQADVTLDAWNIPNGVGIDLCLHGKVLDSQIEIASRATLVLHDCGTNVRKYEPDANGVWIPDENGTKTVTGGVITNDGKVITINTNGSFIMKGGNIVGSKSSNAKGTAVGVNGGSFTMSGGTICGNRNGSNNGAVYVKSGGTFTATSGTITENTGGGVYDEGSLILSYPKIFGNVDKENNPLDIIIGTGASPIDAAEYFNPNNKVNIKLSDTAGAESSRIVLVKDGASAIDKFNYVGTGAQELEMFALGNDIVYGIKPHNHTEIEGELTRLTSVGTELTGGKYYLASDITAAGNITIPDGADVTLCLNGKTLDMGTYTLTVEAGAVLTVCDCTADAAAWGKLLGVDNVTNGACVLLNQGTVKLSSGSIQALYTVNGNTNYTVKNDGGQLYVSGGVVNATGYIPDGAVIYNTGGGEVYVTDGKVTYNYSDTNFVSNTKCITNASGSVTVSGGELIGERCAILNEELQSGTNTVTVTGGKVSGADIAIKNESGAVLNISGSAYITTTHEYATGNMTVENFGKVNMSGGTVESLQALVNRSTGVVEISGGKIISEYILSNEGTITLTGGTIEHNNSDPGSGFIITNNGTMTIDGGSVTSKKEIVNNGTMTVSGGSVTSDQEIVNNGTMTVTDGTVKCTQISNEANATLTVSGGSITGQDYGIYNKGTVYVSGGEIVGNTGLYSEFGAVYVSGGTIRGNGTNSFGYGIGSHASLLISGGEITSANTDAIYTGFDLYLSGAPVISGAKGDITIGGVEGEIVAHSYGVEPVPYSGGKLEITVSTIYNNSTIISGLTDSNKDSFVSYDSDDVLILNGDSIVAHTHKYDSNNWTGSDADGHWRVCTAASCNLVEKTDMIDYTAHTAPSDDGNCTTAIVCPECNYEFTAATAGHTYADHRATVCSVKGCIETRTVELSSMTVQDGNGASHTVYFHSEDSVLFLKELIARALGTTANNVGTLTLNGQELHEQKTLGEYNIQNEATVSYVLLHAHAWAGEWTSNGEAHWHECTAADCDIIDNTKKDGYAVHIPADDGNCLTAAKCPACDRELIAAKAEHSYLNASDVDCNNAGCAHTREFVPTPGDDGREVEFRKSETHIEWRYEGEDDTAWRELVSLESLKGATGTDGKQVELRIATDGKTLQWRLGDGEWADLFDLSLLKGADGQDGTNGDEVELRRTETHIEWKYKTENGWHQLIALSELKGDKGDAGREVEFRKTETHIEWRYVGETEWKPLVALSEITGAAGTNGTNGDEVELRIATDGKTLQWRLGDGEWADLFDLGTLKGADGQDGQDGTNGDEVELRRTETHIEWKYKTEAEWKPLIALSELKPQDGREVEFRKTATHIEWRYVGETEWKALVALSELRGENGQNGTNGAPGMNGANGTNGTNGVDGREVELRVDGGYIQWRYAGETAWKNLLSLDGLKGENGQDGQNGTDGKDGADGADGKDGVDGADGTNGLTPYIGENGNWWIGDTDTGVKAVGTDGKDGADGADGADGQNGADGVDGITVAAIALSSVAIIGNLAWAIVFFKKKRLI